MSTHIPIIRTGTKLHPLRALIVWLQRQGTALAPIRQFIVVSFVIITTGMGLVGWWIASQIAEGVVNSTSKAVSIYIDSLLAPVLQDLATTPTLSVARVREVEWLLNDTSIGQQIVALKIWDSKGKVLYSNNPALINQVFEVKDDLARSWNGEVVADISQLDDPENVDERQVANELLEIYVPVRQRDTGNIIAVVEFYQRMDELQAGITRAQQISWLVVLATGIVMYLLMVGYITQLSRTITQQRIALGDQVQRLTNALRLNRELDGRVRRAAVRTTELNERFQRRLSSELHDGPAQYLSLALLRMDRLSELVELASNPNQAKLDLETIQGALTQTMDEVRLICSGLGLPNLESLTIEQCLSRAIRSHERTTGTSVEVRVSTLPEYAPLSVKITLYRVIQEALTNAFRHANGVGQAVVLRSGNNRIQVEVSDSGPGIAIPTTTDWSEHMGLSGMRERVESIGGIFRIESRPGQGTRIFADLPLVLAEERYE